MQFHCSKNYAIHFFQKLQRLCKSAFFWLWAPYGLRNLPKRTEILTFRFRVAIKTHSCEVFWALLFNCVFYTCHQEHIKNSSWNSRWYNQIESLLFFFRGVEVLNFFAENISLSKSFGEMTDFQVSDYVHRLKNTYILGNYYLVGYVFENTWLIFVGRLGFPSFILPEDRALSFGQHNFWTI